MAFTRKFLKTIGLTEEQIESVMEEHVSVTTGLKDQINLYKENAEQLPSVQKDLNDLRTNTADYAELKKKYEDEHKAFEDFRKKAEEAEALSKVKSAYKALLKAQNVDDKRIDAILKVTSFADKKLGNDGKFENESALSESIKKDWSDFIVRTEEKGANVSTPPANTGAKALTKEDIMKIKNTEERQKAIAENPELFGI